MVHAESYALRTMTTKAQMSESSSPTDDLAVLAERAAGGDKNAMDDLLRLVHPRVLRICRSVLPYSADAEDAAQEALLNIATKIHTYSGRSSFSTWVHSVAANSARSTYRKLKRTAQAAHNPEQMDRPDPRTTSVIAGTRLDLLEALETLERDRPQMVTPLVLRDVYGLSYEEIAKEVGAPLGTIKSRIHDAREVVRPLLRPKD
ncbi:MAG: polymerase sigma-70 factor, subfamily [Kribbellaceae bacterium]|jgi:RNA polymerase sigma-70 factor (ECF subfamily)|nr:polymerase sigma-70 factor, subfamily [Kribbellaceae bacterium]